MSVLLRRSQSVSTHASPLELGISIPATGVPSFALLFTLLLLLLSLLLLALLLLFMIVIFVLEHFTVVAVGAEGERREEVQPGRTPVAHRLALRRRRQGHPFPRRRFRVCALGQRCDA